MSTALYIYMNTSESNLSNNRVGVLPGFKQITNNIS